MYLLGLPVEQQNRNKAFSCTAKVASKLFVVKFFSGLDCVGHSFASVAYFWLRDAVASKRANNLATHLSCITTYLEH